MRRLGMALFVALILSEIVVSPLICLQCCPSQEQSGDDHEACSPWCVACTCCHLAHTVCPEMPQAPIALETVQLRMAEAAVPLPVNPPRDILHVPLVPSALI